MNNSKASKILSCLIAIMLLFVTVFSSAVPAKAEDTKTNKPAASTYTISFDANEGSGNMDSVNVECDKEYVLPQNNFTKKIFFHRMEY